MIRHGRSRAASGGDRDQLPQECRHGARALDPDIACAITIFLVGDFDGCLGGGRAGVGAMHVCGRESDWCHACVEGRVT